MYEGYKPAGVSRNTERLDPEKFKRLKANGWESAEGISIAWGNIVRERNETIEILKGMHLSAADQYTYEIEGGYVRNIYAPHARYLIGKALLSHPRYVKYREQIEGELERLRLRYQFEESAHASN